MVVQDNIRKIAITEEQLASLKESYIKQVVIIKAQSEMVATETIGSKGFGPAAEATAEVLESVNAPTENLVSPFANDNIGSTNIFDSANVAAPRVDARSNVQEVAPTIDNYVGEEVVPTIDKVEIKDNLNSSIPKELTENIDDILNDINKMQEEFADLNIRMIKFGNSIDELLERIRIYLNSKTLNNVNEVKQVGGIMPNSSEVIAPTVEPQINPVESNIQANVATPATPATPNFDTPVFDEGVNIFDQPSSFVR